MSPVGKEIPLSLLERDAEWRASVQESQLAALELLRKEPLAPRLCPICSSEPFDAGSVLGVSYLQCAECHHLFCSFKPTPKFLDTYYKRVGSGQQLSYVNLDTSAKKARQEDVSNPKAEFIAKVIREEDSLNQRGLWVDIGSGIGDLLFAAKNLGFTAVGLEPDPTQADIALSRGIKTHKLFFDSGSDFPPEPGQVKVVSLLNVLEHVPDPVPLLCNLSGRMPPGSYLAVEVPRHPSLSSMIQLAGFSPINRHINPPEHLHLFSSVSLERALESASLESVATWIYGSDALEVFFAVGHALGWSSAFDSKNLVDAVNRLQAQIDLGGLSDNMLVVARKR